MDGDDRHGETKMTLKTFSSLHHTHGSRVPGTHDMNRREMLALALHNETSEHTSLCLLRLVAARLAAKPAARWRAHDESFAREVVEALRARGYDAPEALELEAACAKLRDVVKPWVLAEAKPTAEPPTPEVYACDPSGWVLEFGDGFRIGDNWEPLDRTRWPPVGSDAHYGDNPKSPLRLYGKMGADGKIIPIGRLVDTTDTPHYRVLTDAERKELGLSPHTPPAADHTPTTGIKHDADKPTWWLMPWGAVKCVADNGTLSSIFRAYADAAGRTYDAFAWAQLGHTIIGHKLGESPLDGISDSTMWQAFGEVHKVLEYGAAKYDAHNWQKVLQGPNGAQRYIEACRRHLMADAAGEVNDAASGLPHWAHALCCCLFLIYNSEEGDDK